MNPVPLNSRMDHRRRNRTSFSSIRKHIRVVRASVLAISIGGLAISSLALGAPPNQLDQADATRLLEQTTFGPTDALIAHVRATGVQGWLKEQFATPASQYPTFPYVPPDPSDYCTATSSPTCLRDNYSLFLLQNAFFRNALSGPDQLRQRVAFALSQIFVTSGVTIHEPYGMGRYQQMLLNDAFGNFQDLLTEVTLSPVMGAYLNMVNNDKASGTVNPNENYAREVMQLFSIGVWELNADGSQLLDPQGAPIATYEQGTVDGFSSVFTGWTYPPLPGAPQRNHNPKNFAGTMVAVSADHDFDAKTLLEDTVDTAGKAVPADLAFAVQNIAQHRNVGPFIGKQLIQKLVTGNPSPQYVARVSQVFDNDGTGVRGNLKAVITAILTDPEARGDVQPGPVYGKLREPVLFLTAAARAIGTQSDGVFFTYQSAMLGENLFNADSVFNYYPPTYVVPGTTVLGPEFALQNASTVIDRYNFADALAFGSIGPSATVPGAIGTRPSWMALQSLAANPQALVGELNNLLMHGAMPSAMQSTLLTAITQIAASDSLMRAKTAFYLTVTSPQYQVER